MKRSIPPRPRSGPRSRRKKLALIALGIALVVTGLLLGLIPVIPGTPLVLLGVALVGNHSPRGRWLRWRAVGWLRRRGLPVGPLARGRRTTRARTWRAELPRVVD